MYVNQGRSTLYWAEATRSLTQMLIILTILAIVAQVVFFAIHAKVSLLVDSLVHSSVGDSLLYPVIWLPVFQFFLLQILAYAFIIFWVRYVTFSIVQLYDWRPDTAYFFGVFLWFVLAVAILTLNQVLYAHSFFVAWIKHQPHGVVISHVLLVLSSLIFIVSSLLACYPFVVRVFAKTPLYIQAATMFVIAVIFAIYKHQAATVHVQSTQPNVIIIGLDSLRPDFTGVGKHTPTINAFLQSSKNYTNAYTPLARTFSSWTSILTAKYPHHSRAYVNLANPAPILKNDMLSRRLQTAGYTTFYATDEVRFSNIDERYGFDHVVHPHPGAVDFILGGLSDFPLTNLLINMPGSKWLFPYNHANRAAYITYYPDYFLQNVKTALQSRNKQKPLFLAIHLCLAHWPYVWANDNEPLDYLPAQYKNSVANVDKQLEKLLAILQNEGLLHNTLVILLSDHGTTLGLQGDRIVNEASYMGDKKNLKLLAISKLSSAPEYSSDFKRDYSISTSYGQGTDVLSLKQYHVLLAFKGYGLKLPVQQVTKISSLIDIAPTILDYLNLSPMNHIDGISLNNPAFNKLNRPIFMESGGTMGGLETDKIDTARLVSNAVKAYEVDVVTGALMMSDEAVESVNKAKQHAIIMNDQILAYYPRSFVNKLVKDKSGLTHMEAEAKPPYYVLADLHTGKWKIGADKRMLQKLNQFYDLGANLHDEA